MNMDTLAKALEQFVNSEDWDEARRIVEEHQDLLGNQAQQLLAENINDYRSTNRDDVADYLEEHRAILQRSREIGIAQAFEEAERQARETLEARHREMDALRPSQPTPLQGTVWQLLDADAPEKVDHVLSEHPELTRDQAALEYLDSLAQQAQQAGAKEAVHYLREYHELLRTFYELPPLMRALQEFIAVPTWGESREVLKHNPDLMSAEAISIMDNLIDEAQRQDDEATAHALEAYKRVLERSREVGPDRAIAEIIEPEEEPAAP
ncbi:MAG TPA: hypothetical protein PLJ35_06740 [Anaerolineae bacterium]|nr:hypothetical protein [Anaerolineae bacterium]HOQ98503.1 hypothetical protein [Anaerolineae bacterium]HPL28312.1 hypothetical protein [Anaerolineae bacterium]